jgi:alpha-L-fucosidase
MDLYYRSVGHNCNLLLNANPDGDGLVPEPDFSRYAQFGAEIRRRLGRSIGSTSGQGQRVELRLPAPARVDHAVVMEDIAAGHRIREYVIEAQVGRQWKPVAQGTAVGHKKVDRFEAVEAAALRLVVRRSVAAPQVRSFSAYGGG